MKLEDLNKYKEEEMSIKRELYYYNANKVLVELAVLALVLGLRWT